MPNYLIVYKGEATDPQDMTPEESAAVLEEWGAWMGKVGDSLVEPGAPFGERASVVDDGTQGVPESLTGYSIVSADDLDGARSLLDGHPYLSEGKGDFAIDLFEVTPMPM